MPVHSFDQIKKAPNQAQLNSQADMMVMYTGQLKAGDEPDQQRLVENVKSYALAYQTVIRADVENDAVREAREKLKGFKNYLETRDREGNSNFQKFKAIGSTQWPVLAIAMSGLNEAFGTGVDPFHMAVEAQKKPFVDVLHQDEENLSQNDVRNSVHNEGPQVNQEEGMAQPAAAAQQISGSRYIQNIQAQLPTKNPADMEMEEREACIRQLFQVIAARNLCDSDRGKKAKLVNTNVEPEKVDDLVEKMFGHDNFRDFSSALKLKPALLQQAMTACRKGHGGGLDDMYKSFLKDLGPGELVNDKMQERYMPTAQERIKALQAKAKVSKQASRDMTAIDEKLKTLAANSPEKENLERTKLDLQLKADSNDLTRIASEIVQIRNIAHLSRGSSKNLDKKIPTGEEDELSSTVRAMYSAQALHQAVKKEYILKHLEDGHGGELAADLRKESANTMMLYAARKAIYANTVGTRLGQIRTEARHLKDDFQMAIQSGNEADIQRYRKQSEELLGEFFLLDGVSRSGKGATVDEGKLNNMDVPWDKVEQLKKNGPNSNKTFQTLMKDRTPSELCTIIGNCASKSQAEFVSELAEEMQARKATKKAEEKKGPVTNMTVDKKTGMINVNL